MSKLSTEIPNGLIRDAEANPAAESGCPTPLAWQDVLQAVREERRSVSVELGSLSITGAVIGSGEPLYLLPGFVGDHELFVLTSWLLREECCCIMLDPPRIPRASPDMLTQLSRGLLMLAGQLGHRQFHLHATSLGSLIALRTMLDEPDRLLTVSMHCGFAGYKLTLFERLVATLGRRSVQTLGELQAAVRLQVSNHQRWFPPFDGTRWNFYLQNVAATPLAEIAQRALLAHAVNLRGELDRMSTPTLLIGCEGDGRVSAAAQAELAERLPHGQTESLDHCGRLPHVTHPHRLVKSLRAFWEAAS